MTPSDDDRVHRRLALNTISNVARFAFLMAITFFLTPFIVRTLGDALYGFWILLMSFLGYASILEMGVQPAVVKLVGQHRAVGENDRLCELITAALVFFLSIGALVVLLSVTVLPLLVHRYVSGLETLERSNLLYLMIALDATVMYINYLLTGILYGCQRYHLKNMIDVAGWVLNVILIVSFLEGGGMLALMRAKLSMDLMVMVFSLIAVPRVFPELRVDLKSLQRSSFRDLMSFGGRVFLSATTTRIAFHAQPVIISTSLGSAATGFYAIPVKLVDYTRQISWTLTASFMPMFSELESRKDRTLLRSIYLDYSRYIFMMLLPLPVLLFTYGPEFIGHWIGPEYEDRGRWALYLLTATALIDNFQPLIWRFFIGVGHLNILVLVSAIVSVLTVVGSILLVGPLGIAGVAVSLLAGAVVSQIMYLLHACRYLEISWFEFLMRVNLRPLAVAVVVFFVARILASTIGSSTYIAMIAGSLISTLVHVALCVRVAITGEERGALLGKLSSLMPGR